MRQMDSFRITEIPAFNGDYPIDLTRVSMKEAHIIKEISGVRAGEYGAAFAAGDTDMLLAWAVVAVKRSGKDWEQFLKIAWDVSVDAIEFVNDTEADAVPLTQTPSGESGSSSEQTARSGQPSPNGGDDSPETNLRAIGDPSSATG